MFVFVCFFTGLTEDASPLNNNGSIGVLFFSSSEFRGGNVIKLEGPCLEGHSNFGVPRVAPL